MLMQNREEGRREEETGDQRRLGELSQIWLGLELLKINNAE